MNVELKCKNCRGYGYVTERIMDIEIQTECCACKGTGELLNHRPGRKTE